MNEYCAFLDDTFSFSILLVADIPKRYNLMALEGVAESDALRRVLGQGDQLMSQLERITRHYGRVKVSRWGHFQSAAYEKNVAVLSAAYRQDELVRAQVDTVARNFLNHPQNTLKYGMPSAEKVRIAAQYVVDEMAMELGITLSFRQPLVEIYPGKPYVEDLVQSFPKLASQLSYASSRRFLAVYPTVQPSLQSS